MSLHHAFVCIYNVLCVWLFWWMYINLHAFTLLLYLLAVLSKQGYFYLIEILRRASVGILYTHISMYMRPTTQKHLNMLSVALCTFSAAFSLYILEYSIYVCMVCTYIFLLAALPQMVLLLPLYFSFTLFVYQLLCV